METGTQRGVRLCYKGRGEGGSWATFIPCDLGVKSRVLATPASPRQLHAISKSLLFSGPQFPFVKKEGLGQKVSKVNPEFALQLAGQRFSLFRV